MLAHEEKRVKVLEDKLGRLIEISDQNNEEFNEKHNVILEEIGMSPSPLFSLPSHPHHPLVRFPLDSLDSLDPLDPLDSLDFLDFFDFLDFLALNLFVVYFLMQSMFKRC